MRQILKLAFLFVVGVCVFTGCENDDEYQPSIGKKMEFISQPMALENTIDYIWYKVNGADSYTIQIANNAEFANPVVNDIVSGTTYKATGLDFDVAYYSRVRANFPAGAGEWLNSEKPLTLTHYREGTMKLVSLDAVYAVDATFNWFETEYLETIQVTDSITGEVKATYTLTEDDINNRSAVIANLPRNNTLNAHLMLSATHPEPAKRGLKLNSVYFKPVAPRAVILSLTSGTTPVVDLLPGFNATDLTLFQITHTLVGGVDKRDSVVLATHTLTPADITAASFKFKKQLPNIDIAVVAYDKNAPASYPQYYFPQYIKTFIPAPIKVKDQASLVKALGDAKNEDILLLKSSMTASLGAYTFKAGYTIKGEEAITSSFPKITLNESFNVEGTIDGNPIVFENIAFLPGTNAKYVFNSKTAGSNVGKIMFKNCTFTGFAEGIYYLTNVATDLDSLVFENCIFTWANDVAGTKTGLVNPQGNNSKIQNVYIKNSTIANLNFPLLGNNNYVAPSTRYALENVTIYSLNRIDDHIIRSGGTLYLSMRNMIFAQAVNEDGTSDNNYRWQNRLFINGNQILNGAFLNENIYGTSDFNTGWSGSKAQPKLPTLGSDGKVTMNNYSFLLEGNPTDIMRLSGITSRVFKDPYKGDFTLNNSADVIGIGDPRWWPKSYTGGPKAFTKVEGFDY